MLFAKPNVETIPADAHNFGSRKGAFITGIVLHATQGWKPGVTKRFRDSEAQVSCHYLITRDGAITQYVPDDFAAWHSGNGEVNRHSIGIEIEAMIQDVKTLEWLKQPDGFTEQQYNSLVQLMRFLISRYPIKPVRYPRGGFSCIGIIAHSDVPDPHHEGQYGGINHHEDPGPYFTWWDMLLKATQPPPESPT